MRTFLTSVILLFVSTALSAADPLAERMESGWRALQSGELEKAAAVYLEILTSNPRYTAARHLLGVCQLQMGRMADGIRSLEVVRKENPQNRQAEYTLVSTYVALSMFDEAQKIVDTTLRTDRTAEACFMRGSYRMARADYEGAIRELETARKMNPKLPGVRSMLGVTYGFANRSDQAIPMLEAALKENARDGNAAAFLGWLYKERDRGSEATTLLEQTVKERPGDFGALFLLAQLTQARGQAAEAVTMLEKVVEAQPEHRGAYVLLARLYQQLQRPADAARARNVVAQLNAAQQAAQPGAR